VLPGVVRQLNSFRAEFHVHTVLSPCAQVEMIPPLIVQQAIDQNIQIIAITDHNATANIRAVQQAAKDSGLFVLPGMELQTREEVHVICLFDGLDQAEELQSRVDRRLPDIQNRPDFFGEQFVVDETGEFIRRDHRLLLNSVEVDFNEAWEWINELGGLFIPAHVNRKGFGLLANLGLVPTDIPIEVLEISRHLKPADAPNLFPQIKGYPLLQSGDVHGLDGFLGVNEFQIKAPTIAEFKMALRSEAGRSVRIVEPS
jgi:3',5'-nucleoside bisphosphate phosphatase